MFSPVFHFFRTFILNLLSTDPPFVVLLLSVLFYSPFSPFPGLWDFGYREIETVLSFILVLFASMVYEGFKRSVIEFFYANECNLILFSLILPYTVSFFSTLSLVATMVYRVYRELRFYYRAYANAYSRFSFNEFYYLLLFRFLFPVRFLSIAELTLFASIYLIGFYFNEFYRFLSYSFLFSKFLSIYKILLVANRIHFLR